MALQNTDFQDFPEAALTGPTVALDGGSLLTKFLWFLSQGAEPLSHVNAASKDKDIELSLFDEGIKDKDPLLRGSWFGVVASRITDGTLSSATDTHRFAYSRLNYM